MRSIPKDMQRAGPQESGAFGAQKHGDEVRAYPRRLVQTPNFRSSTRRARLLEYLCDRTLRGEGDEITEYAIGLDVFSKPPSFDPRGESTVRAEITRLRQKLRQYYEHEGANDEIRIDLPARSYVPAFIFLQDSAIASSPPEPVPPLPSSRNLLKWPLAAAALLLAVCVARNDRNSRYGIPRFPTRHPLGAHCALDGLHPEMNRALRLPLGILKPADEPSRFTCYDQNIPRVRRARGSSAGSGMWSVLCGSVSSAAQ